MSKNPVLCIVGLGYVGLPLAVEFAKHFTVHGFDISEKRVAILRKGRDPNREVDSQVLSSVKIEYSSNPSVIRKADFVVVAVPTPIDDHKIPDLTPVVKASETVGRNLKRGAIVVYESTVYPGVTEDECVPILESEIGPHVEKGLLRGIFAGTHQSRATRSTRCRTITKVVSGDTPETLETVAAVYGAAVKAGVYRAPSIKVAEAAKVIENTQRDINIALMNELRIIFDKMGISTTEVLAAAKTKWNFLPFEPGLVGGHCIGVDPYYLAYKAEEIGHHPQIIMAGRRINDAMGRYFGREIVKEMTNKGICVKDTRALVLGITFKENVPDIRNSKVIDIMKELAEFGVKVDVWEPVADAEEVRLEYGITPIARPKRHSYDAVVLAVKHREFLELGRAGLSAFLKPNGVFFDVKEALG